MLSFIVCLNSCSTNKVTTPNTRNTKEQTNIIQKRIAIITPVTHPSLKKIQDGFVQTLTKQNNCSFNFSVFNANGSETLLRSQIEEIATSNFDLIFTIATHPTCLAKEILQKKNNTTPIVFGAVANPHTLGLISTKKQSQSFVTGVSETIDHKQQLDLLLLLKPTIKKIILLYNPTQGTGLEENKNIISKILEKKEITLTSVQAYNTNEIQSKIAGLIQGNDALLVLKDNTVVPAIPYLAQLCSRYGVTLCTSDLDSCKHGAAFSFGVNERDFGIQAAKKALLILHEKKHPSTIPVTPLTNFKLLLNHKTMCAQNLIPDSHLMFLIKSGKII